MIAFVEERGGVFWVYDQNKRILFNHRGDELMGYTGSSVTIRSGSHIVTYNDQNQIIANRSI